MKKLFLAAILFMAMGMANAETYKIYASLIFRGTMEVPTMLLSAGAEGETIKDKDGNELEFNTVLPLLGYMQSIGWTVPDIEKQIMNSMNPNKEIHCFLLSKEVSEKEWLDWIESGKKKQ